MVIAASKEPSPYSALWEKAFNENYRHLCSLARIKLTNGNSVAAEETISEAFVRAIHYAKQPDKIGNLAGYIWRISTRVWINRQKSERTRIIDSFDNPDKESLVKKLPTTYIEPDILALLDNEKLRKEIKANQGPLTPREELLLTRHLEGYSCDEIADELNDDVRLIGVELNAVRNKVRHRLKKARERRR